MDLHLPDPLALLEAGHLEADVRADAPLERGIEIRGRFVAKITTPPNSSNSLSRMLTVWLASRS